MTESRIYQWYRDQNTNSNIYASDIHLNYIDKLSKIFKNTRTQEHVKVHIDLSLLALHLYHSMTNTVIPTVNFPFLNA